jgi:hypothetical protein
MTGYEQASSVAFNLLQAFAPLYILTILFSASWSSKDSEPSASADRGR